ncbi:hypothetical protein ALQ08_103689 [Pseudomonas syringae pv. delphinii]|uniref:Uncharacterized protein n=1 Tax=Pseudomonas syringae pv. delphinii TaxID=192088 RepID=A0A0P9QS46_9PSED|nr:hypothetical protein ALO72_102987 [Pseudomonas syringae pv. delphinii]RMP09798.1 hypothetical protein ALQ28_103499 [Pseudomonas syringae pv. delphinii]RMP16810.1 hypothetical protein ALQ27_103751 [Pseudomonas syringae pv. delphinii]RMQ17602.1 hypothetical protein ALQ08_103689 [Pseudomonas syringae pv. delphinii]
MHNEKPPALHSGGFSSPDKSAIDSMTIVENRPVYVFRKDADHSGKHFNIIACRVQHCASTRPQRMACALSLPKTCPIGQRTFWYNIIRDVSCRPRVRSRRRSNSCGFCSATLSSGVGEARS